MSGKVDAELEAIGSMIAATLTRAQLKYGEEAVGKVLILVLDSLEGQENPLYCAKCRRVQPNENPMFLR